MVGSNLGLHAGTPEGTALALTFNADYYLDEHFSLGPMLQFGVNGDLFHLGISWQAKHVFENPRFPQILPHLQGGLGFILVNTDAGSADDNDLGFLVPFGGGIEVPLMKNLSVASTLLLNFTDAKVAGNRSNIFMTWIFGIQVRL